LSLLPILVLVGLTTGLISSFFGVGGGVIVIPALFFLIPKLPPQNALGISLGMIFFNSLLNTYNFHRSGVFISKRVVLSIGPTMVLGTLLSSYANQFISPIVVKQIFACALIFVAVRAIRLQNSPQNAPQDPTSPSPRSQAKLLLGIFIGLAGGLVAGLTGLGGGIVLVPSFINFYKMPFINVTATSNAA